MKQLLMRLGAMWFRKEQPVEASVASRLSTPEDYPVSLSRDDLLLWTLRLLRDRISSPLWADLSREAPSEILFSLHQQSDDDKFRLRLEGCVADHFLQWPVQTTEDTAACLYSNSLIFLSDARVLARDNRVAARLLDIVYRRQLLPSAKKPLRGENLHLLSLRVLETSDVLYDLQLVLEENRDRIECFATVLAMAVRRRPVDYRLVASSLPLLWELARDAEREELFISVLLYIPDMQALLRALAGLPLGLDGLRALCKATRAENILFDVSPDRMVLTVPGKAGVLRFEKTGAEEGTAAQEMGIAEMHRRLATSPEYWEVEVNQRIHNTNKLSPEIITELCEHLQSLVAEEADG